MKRMNLGAMLLTGMSATWAADEWYLLTPPMSDFDVNAPALSRYKVLDDKPLPQWRRGGTFESSSDCQAARIDQLKRQQRHFDSVYSSFREYANKKDAYQLQLVDLMWQSEGSHENVLAYAAARCARSDDQQL